MDRSESKHPLPVQSNQASRVWTLHEKYAKYPITQFIARQNLMACNTYKTAIV